MNVDHDVDSMRLTEMAMTTMVKLNPSMISTDQWKVHLTLSRPPIAQYDHHALHLISRPEKESSLRFTLCAVRPLAITEFEEF